MANEYQLTGNEAKNIAVAKTTYLARSYGVLNNISLNTNGGTVTVYDSTTGSGTLLGSIASDAPEGTYLQNIAFYNGLTIVTGGTADVTVTYRAGTSGWTVVSVSPSSSSSVSESPSASVSPSASTSISPSASVSPSASTSISPSASTSPSASVSPSASRSPSASESKSISPSSSVSPSSSLSPSASESQSLSPSTSLSPSASVSISPSSSPSWVG